MARWLIIVTKVQTFEVESDTPYELIDDEKEWKRVTKPLVLKPWNDPSVTELWQSHPMDGPDDG